MLTTAIKCHSLPFTLRVRGITLHSTLCTFGGLYMWLREVRARVTGWHHIWTVKSQQLVIGHEKERKKYCRENRFLFDTLTACSGRLQWLSYH